MRDLIASWAAYAATAAALFSACAAAAPGALASPLAAAFAARALSRVPWRAAAPAAAAALWLAAFRKNFPLVWHARGFAAVAWRAAVVLARGRGLRAPGDARATRHRVLLGDLDFNMHMNNAIYNTEVDLQRFGFFVDLFAGHVPWAFPLLRWGWGLHNGGVAAWFLRELRLGAAYELRTRVCGIDQKWHYLRSDFVVGTTLHAVVVTRVVVKIGRRTVPPADALARVGYASADIAALLAAGAPRDAPDVAAGPTLSAVALALAGADAPADTPRPAAAAADARKER